MITVSSAPPALSSDILSLYYTRDVAFGSLPILVFYGHSTTGNSTLNSSRIQAHIYSIVGFQSFPRLTIAPTSPLYAAVNYLPAELQGDEVARGLAVALLSYFQGLPESVKAALRGQIPAHRLDQLTRTIFDEMHAGELASRMELVEDSREIADHILSALSMQVLSWINMDVILPTGTIQRATSTDGYENTPLFGNDGLPLYHYGQYTHLVETLGSPAFLPTSKLRRAPSRSTAHSKNKLLHKDQKISLRREMCELVDTEHNYISKLKDLISCVPVEVKAKVEPKILEGLFPKCLVGILEVNETFHNDILSILEDTENEAIRDIEGASASSEDPGSPITQGRRRDPTGTLHFAKALLRWFPRFLTPYQEYLRASANFPAILAQNLADGSSAMADLIHAFGEQQLRSILIEPVQRLPRYSLLIDNMVNNLPTAHPAFSSLLRAKDVITEICALDSSSSPDGGESAKRLQNIIAEWPVDFPLNGRLITAVDVLGLDPPYEEHAHGIPGVMLLFPGTIVLLRKAGNSPLSARGILAEIDRPITSGQVYASSTSPQKTGLEFVEALPLFGLQFSESLDGRIFRIAVPTQAPLSSTVMIHDSCPKSFLLYGPYDGKASRLGEEISKAMIESFYPEDVRDSGKWTLRSINPLEQSLGVVIALMEDQVGLSDTPVLGMSSVQLSIDCPKTTITTLGQSRGLDIAATVTRSGIREYRLEVEDADGNVYTDKCTTESVVEALLARLNHLLYLRRQAHSPRSMQSQISYSRRILETIPLKKQQDEGQTRGSRPLSPVKLISNFLNGVPSNQSHIPSRRRHAPSISKDLPSLPPPKTSEGNAFSNSAQETNSPNSKVTLVDSNTETYQSPLSLLEDTFLAYTVCLRSHSGNVVGKALRNRAAADELLVNELYNALLEDPSRIQAAAESSMDVLFSAFEKFLKIAWTERMGPLLSPSAAHSMQSAFDTGRLTLFSKQIKRILEEMSPQNRRAFVATVKLLSDLLDASGNDGDRGALIASFTEVLILTANPHDYVTLLDRLVDDYDNLFDDIPTFSADAHTASTTGSLARTRSFNTGSLSSNASSLRRKFGFGTMSRENSKKESESKVASIWRSLSKNAISPGESQSQPSSLSKASLARSRSTDTDSRMLPPLRPVSRDRPLTSDSAGSDEPKSRPGSAHMNMSTLSSIGENTPTKLPIAQKKKRRSSLSDLKLLQQPDPHIAWSPLQPHKVAYNQVTAKTTTISPKTPSTQQAEIRVTDRQSPKPLGLPRPYGSPHRKEGSSLRENSPITKGLSMSSPSPSSKATVKPRSEEVVITSLSPQKRHTSRSGIPALKGGLSERTWPPNTNPPKQQQQQPPQKLRMQSPQKLRERLSQERKALAISDDSFQAEMTKISEELVTYKLHQSPTKARPAASAQPVSNAIQVQTLSQTLDSLSTRLKSYTTAQSASLTSLSSDLETSLLVANKKARQLDELYREANAENEALYERFNEELGKILAKVKRGEGVEEMRMRLGEAQEDVARVRRENARLKREVVGLRSLMKGE